MSQENVRLVKAAIEAWNRGDVDAAVEVFDPAVVWRMDENWADRIEYRGHAGVRDFVRSWEEPWEEFSIRLDESVQAGDRLATRQTFRGRMAGSDAWIEQEYGAVYRFSSGKITEINVYPSWERTAEAAGLGE